MNFASAAVVEVVRYPIADFGADLDSTPVTKLCGACREDSESRKSKAVNL